MRTTGLSRRTLLGTAGVGALALASGSALSGCGLFDSPSEQGERSIATYWLNPDTLDPQLVSDGMWLDQQGLFEGLVVSNDEGNDVVPGVAESWSVSSDGTVWTFHLRGDAKWSTGDAVTADDFVWTYERLLSPGGEGTGVTTGANSYVPSLGIRNAVQFLAGSVTDFTQVGVRAVSATELEITLNAPNSAFLLGLTHPSMLPLARAALEQHPSDWSEPENWVSNGPFILSRWDKNSSMTFVPNPHYWDQDAIQLDSIEVKLAQAGQAPTPVAYENHEVDFMGVSAVQVVPYIGKEAYADQLRPIAERQFVYLATLRSSNPVLEDVRVRKALSLAMGRKPAAEVVAGATPAPSLVPSVLPRSDGLGVVEDVDQARQLLADAGFPDGKGFPQLTILTEGDRPENDVVVDQWKTNLGVDVRINQVERGVYVAQRWKVLDTPGFYSGQFKTRPTWADTILTLWAPQTMEEFSLPGKVWKEYLAVQADDKLKPAEKSKKLGDLRAAHASEGAKQYSTVAAQAGEAPDIEGAQALFRQAAQIRDDLFLALPVSWHTDFYLARAEVEGLHLRIAPETYYYKGVSISSES